MLKTVQFQTHSLLSSCQSGAQGENFEYGQVVETASISVVRGPLERWTNVKVHRTVVKRLVCVCVIFSVSNCDNYLLKPSFSK